MKSERMKFTDLLTQLSPTDETRRNNIDDANLVQATNLAEFLHEWSKLSIQIDENSAFIGTVETLPSITDEKYLCLMQVLYQRQQGLNLSFAVRDAPPQAGHLSMVALTTQKYP